MEKHGVDISRWNKIVDYDTFSHCIDFAIIKAGGSDKGIYKDPTFNKNYTELHSRGVPLGVYYFVGRNFLTHEDAIADAKRFIEIIQGLSFEYPVVLDLESTAPRDKEDVTYACIDFMNYLEESGYYACIYASDISGFKDRLILDWLTPFDKWVARYGGKPTYVTEYGIHQYTSKGDVPGAIGYIDRDVAYKDYPSIMKKTGYNNVR